MEPPRQEHEDEVQAWQIREQLLKMQFVREKKLGSFEKSANLN